MLCLNVMPEWLEILHELGISLVDIPASCCGRNAILCRLSTKTLNALPAFAYCGTEWFNVCLILKKISNRKSDQHLTLK